MNSISLPARTMTVRCSLEVAISRSLNSQNNHSEKHVTIEHTIHSDVQLAFTPPCTISKPCDIL